MYDIVFVKEKIKELKKELKNYEKILVDLCPHENTAPYHDKNSSNEDEQVFICSDCGMIFVTDDSNIKYIKNLIV